MFLRLINFNQLNTWRVNVWSLLFVCRLLTRMIDSFQRHTYVCLPRMCTPRRPATYLHDYNILAYFLTKIETRNIPLKPFNC